MNSAAKLSILVVIALTGCQAASVAPDPEIVYKTKMVDTACAWTRIITVAKEDVLTDETARQILAHDRAYKANCGKK